MSDEDVHGHRSPHAAVRLTPPPRVPASPPGWGRRREGRSSWRGPALVAALVLASGALILARPRAAQVPPAGVAPAHVPSAHVPSPYVPSPYVPSPHAPSPHAPSTSTARPAPALPPPESPRPRVVRDPQAAPEPSPDAAFLEAMSAGHRALDAGDWSVATEAFGRAEALRPGHGRDGLLRAEEGERLAAVEARRRKGAAAETAEDWRTAAAEYEAALKLDPALAFALDGYGRAAERARLQARLDRHLAAPRRLSAEAVEREVERLLERVRELQPLPPGLEQRAALLERRLAEAKSSVRVELRSDGLTEVTVLRVGRLGGFAERVLDLRPGPYTIVGTRKGYRDVRLEVVIEAGREPAPIDVRCMEAL